MPIKGQSPKEVVHTDMHKFKHGSLHSGSKHGPLVKSRKQAIAIALSESGQSNKKSHGGKVSTALRVAKKYARGGEIDDNPDPSNGGQIPRSLQYMMDKPPKSWTVPPQRYADGGETGGDVDWSKLNQPFGELKGTAPEDTPVAFKTAAGPNFNIHEGDIDRGMNVAMAAGPGTMVGPYGAHMLRAANRASVKPHPVNADEIAERAKTLRPEFQDIYKGAAQDMRDAEGRAILEMRGREGSGTFKDNDVWNRSGWSYGPAGEITKEIPDIGAKLVKIPGTDKYELKHPAGDYHKIYDIPPITHNPGIMGRGNQAEIDMVNGNKIAVADTKKVNPVLHEVQHAIDKSEGASYPRYIGQMNELKDIELEKSLQDRTGSGVTLPPWQYAMVEKAHKDQGHLPPKNGTFSEEYADRIARHIGYLQQAGETKPRNVQERFKHGFSYRVKPEFTEDIPRGLQSVDERNMPRPRKDIKIYDLSAMGPNDTMPPTGSHTVGELSKGNKFRNYARGLVEKAGGGGVGNFNPERAEAFGLAKQGMISSSVPGRTDKLNLKVPNGSYILPADTVSALGEGNSMAGGAILTNMFKRGPYGMNLPKSKGGTRLGPRHSSLMKASTGFADGGNTDHMDIIAAGGEYVIHPETIRRLGGGDLETGHKILDEFVKHIRSKHVKTLRKLKPPKGSK